VPDYWGARIFYTEGQDGEGSRYFNEFRPGDNYEPTQRAGESNSTIEEIRQQIMNQHPEDISALADQWQNGYNLLSSIKDQLLGQSQTLYNESWGSSAAKDLFMERGPGKTLVYLDEWMTAAEYNRDSARGMVGIATDSRSRMETLWADYEAAVEAAQNVSGGRKAWEWAWHYNLVSAEWKRGTFGIPYLDVDFGNDEEYNQVLDAYRADQVSQVREEYNQRARELAVEVAGQYFDYLTASGHGPPFSPMNVVLNIPGQGFWAGMPPGGMPGPPGTAPGSVPSVPPPVPVAPPAPGPLSPVGTFGAQPLVAPSSFGGTPPVAPPAPLTATGPVAPAGAPAPPPATAAGPAAFGGPLVAPLGRGIAPPGGTLSGPAAGSGAGPAAPLAASPQAPAGLRGGVLRGPGVAGATPGAPGAAPPTGALPPGAAPPAKAVPPGARSPAAGLPPPALGRNPPGRRPPREAGPLGPGPAQTANPGRLQGPFAGPPPSTAPPVLNNPGPRRSQRPGSRDELMPSGPRGDQRPGTPGTAGAAPPVLNNPSQQPGRPVPPVPGQPGQRAPERRGAAGPGRPQPPDTAWVGTDEVRPEVSAPVLDGPAAPLTGSAVSKLEEVPAHLRRSTPAGPRAGGTRPDGTVAPELTARRTSREQTGGNQPGTEPEAAAERVVTDEQAFTVETPGGGVLGKQREESPYQAEPPTVLGGR
jgi:hypothetical protein